MGCLSPQLVPSPPHLSHSVSPMYVSWRNSTGKAKGEWGSVVVVLDKESDAQWWMVLVSLSCSHPGSRSRLDACWTLATAVSSAPCCLWSTSVLQAGHVDGLITNDFTDSLWQEGTELNLAPPEYLQMRQGEPTARSFSSLQWHLWEQNKGPEQVSGVSPVFAPHRLASGLPKCSGWAAGRAEMLAGHTGLLSG